MKNLKQISNNNINNLSFCMSNTTLFLDNIREKKVLVLGSGPSSKEINWANRDWDVLVTTSRFYLVPEILEQKPIHVTLSNQLNLKDKTLIKYLDNNPHCTIGFEVLLATGHSILPIQTIKQHPTKWPEFREKYKDRIVYYQTFIEDYSKQIGVGSRVCYPVLMANPKSLLICGIDGVSKSPKKDPINYFRENKGATDWGSLERETKLYNNYKLDYEEFGENIYKIGNHHNIPIYNLGKGKPYNMITPISERYEKP